MNVHAFLLFVALGASGDGPLAIAEPAVDRGEAKAGLPLVHHFELANRSNQPLTIEQVAAGCGCLQPRISTRELKPGETARLEIAINTLSQPAGAQAWTAQVHWRQGDATGTRELRVRATVIREIDIQPVALGITTTEAATHAITLTDRRAKPLTVTSARTSSPELNVRLGVRAIGPDGSSRQQVHLTITDAYPPGRRVETVQLLTDDPEYRELRVPATIDRRSANRVVAMPDEVDLRLARGQTSANSLVRLKSGDDQPVLVDRFEADHPALRFRWAPGPESMATLRLSVEIPADAPSGKGTITVHLKEPAGQIVTIPVRWDR
jgi:Fe-S cluster assembly iron-binding protein IscA